MRSSSLIVPALGLAFGSLVACGGADAVNFFATPAVSGGGGASAGASKGDGNSNAGASNAGASNGDDDSSPAGTTSVAGTSNAAGTSNGAGASSAAGGDGTADAAGATTVAGAGSAGTSSSGPSDAPCGPVIDLSANGNQKNVDLQSAGPVCLLISDDIVGWGCANFEGRTLKVNGVQVRCAQLPLPDKLHGAYYFDISAGDHSYASMYWY